MPDEGAPGGGFLTSERLKLCFFAVAVVYATTLAVHATRSHWLFDIGGDYVPTDFVAFWAAGRLALEGHASQVYDWAVHHAMAVEGVGPHRELLPWLNPPSFLVFVAPFAAFSYPVAMVAWLGLTLALFVIVIRAIVGHDAAWWGALAFPGVIINIAAGQGGFLTASLTGGGLLLRHRPFVAGMLIGLLTIKPQLGILFPIALLAGRSWPAMAGAVLTAALPRRALRDPIRLRGLAGLRLVADLDRRCRAGPRHDGLGQDAERLWDPAWRGVRAAGGRLSARL